jgi:hypothetical protein
MILFWCLMSKGEKLRPKQMDQLPLENFENSRVRIFYLSKILLLQNLVPCGREFMIMGVGTMLRRRRSCGKKQFRLKLLVRDAEGTIHEASVL